MKLAIIFEVPDGQAEAYADVAARMIQHHAFAEQQKIKHWSFDLEMRPVEGFAAETNAELALMIANSIDWTATSVYSEALRESWARNKVAEAGHSWDTHMVKFSGVVLPR